VFPAVGYRFDYGGRSVVVSGDTAASDSVARAATGADLLLHEGLQTTLVNELQRTATRAGRTTLAQIAADIPSYHTTPEDAARIAARAGVAQLVFYHTIPPLPTAYLNGAFLGDARRLFAGPVTVSTDGLLFTLPTGTSAITQRNLL
jgi:ribonuclease Z